MTATHSMIVSALLLTLLLNLMIANKVFAAKPRCKAGSKSDTGIAQIHPGSQMDVSGTAIILFDAETGIYAIQPVTDNLSENSRAPSIETRPYLEPELKDEVSF